MTGTLPWLTDKRLLAAGEEADALAATGHEPAEIVACVVNQAVTGEVLDRLGRS